MSAVQDDIAFNVQQQELIHDFLDEARRNNPELEWFFAEDRIEPVIVKNLENIQGDERDVILFSITFRRDAAGKLPMTFGAINRIGGERRLNVAVTRARRELKVFSGIRADDIDLGRSKALGVRHLKTFLDYAARGAIALPAEVSGPMGEAESPFEAASILSSLTPPRLRRRIRRWSMRGSCKSRGSPPPPARGSWKQ